MDAVKLPTDKSSLELLLVVKALNWESEAPRSFKSSQKINGALCPKGQAGLQTIYDTYRIRKVLKRAGKRGENKWMTIPFDQAIDEIVNGGYLFKHVLGKENQYVLGLKDIWTFKDPKVAKEMADEMAKIRKVAKEVNDGKKPNSKKPSTSSKPSSKTTFTPSLTPTISTSVQKTTNLSSFEVA